MVPLIFEPFAAILHNGGPCRQNVVLEIAVARGVTARWRQNCRPRNAYVVTDLTSDARLPRRDKHPTVASNGANGFSGLPV